MYVVTKCSVYLKIKLCILCLLLTNNHNAVLNMREQNLYFQNPFFSGLQTEHHYYSQKYLSSAGFSLLHASTNPTSISATPLKDPPTASFAVMDGAYL